MREENDWRLQGQEKYLKGVSLWRKQYTRYSESWDHDHCSFCWIEFSEDEPGALREGYTTKGDYHWVCERCFEDFKDMFEWKVIQAEESNASNAI